MEFASWVSFAWYSIFLLVPAVWLFQQWSRHLTFAKALNKLPGPPALPLLGNTLEFWVKAEELFHLKLVFNKRYRYIYRVWLMVVNCVVIAHPRHIESLLSSVKYIEKGMFYFVLWPWMGTGLLTSGGRKWHLHRKLLTPAFHFKILDEFLPVFHEKSHFLIKKLREQVGSSGFNFMPRASLYTLDVICETAMGSKIDVQENSNTEYITAIRKLSDILYERVMAPWLYPDFLFHFSSLGREHNRCLKIVHGFTEKVIRQRKEYMRSIKQDKIVDGKRRRLAFLDLLIEASQDGSILTDRDIREEVDTFMFEGHDTVSAAMSWSLFLLGNHQDIQEKVFEELTTILGSAEKSPTMEDLAEMKLLERCIKEALRLYPSVAFFMRQLTEDAQIGEHIVPAGTNVFFDVHGTHRDPEFFPNPDEFNPDNFLPEKVQGRHPYAYLPFSAGPRNCIGQKFAMLELKSVLSSVLMNFRIESLQKPKELNLLIGIVLKPKEGVWIRVHPRTEVAA